MIRGSYGVPPKGAAPVIDAMAKRLGGLCLALANEEREFPEAVASALVELVLRMVREEPSLGAVIKGAIDQACREARHT